MTAKKQDTVDIVVVREGVNINGEARPLGALIEVSADDFAALDKMQKGDAKPRVVKAERIPLKG